MLACSLAASACSSGDEPGRSGLERAGDTAHVSVEGGPVDLGGVMALVPPGQAIEAWAGTIPEAEGERFGTPIVIEHDEEFTDDVIVRWDIGELTPPQRDAITVVRWNETEDAWHPDTSGAELRITGDTLEVSVRQFSGISWNTIANLGQTVGELTGSRKDGPACSGSSLHDWVQNTVEGDEDTNAAAIRVCFEPDRDEIVTARVVNNRTFTQRLRMDEGGQTWAWTWGGAEDYGVSAAVYSAARTVFDSGTSHLMPPLSETAVGIGRPNGAGHYFISATADVDAVTVLVDLVRFVLDQQSIGGLDNPLMNAAVQLLFECGGKQLLDRPEVEDVLPVAVDVLASCASELFRPSSEIGQAYENLVRRQIEQAQDAAGRQRVANFNRSVGRLASAAKVLTVGKMAFYASDQLQNAIVGNLTLSVSGMGRPGPIGGWETACTDASNDVNQLYRDIALREPFSDVSIELHDFAELSSAADAAVAPLADCDGTYLSTVARLLPEEWADAEAGAIVAAAVLAMAPNQPDPVEATLTPTGLGPLVIGMSSADATATGLIDEFNELCFIEPIDVAELRPPFEGVIYADAGVVIAISVAAGAVASPGGIGPGGDVDVLAEAWRDSGFSVDVDDSIADVFGEGFVYASHADGREFGATFDPQTRTIGRINAPYVISCE
jgi:hypothetical protein